MTLKENAFMYDLIKRSHRRRITIFWIYVVITLVPIYFIFSANGDVATTARLFMWAFIDFLLLLFFVFSYVANDKNPWTIKRNQLKVLEEQKESNFEELKVCVPLQEYFYL